MDWFIVECVFVVFGGVGRGKLKERWDFYEEVNVFWGLGFMV